MKGREYYNNAYINTDKYKYNYKESEYYFIWINILGLIKKEKIFEGGCGTGQFAKMLIDNGKNYQLGIDFSKEAIRIAKDMNPGNEDKFEVRDLLGKIEIDYDLFLCLEVLEHIDNDLEVLGKIKKDKKVILSVPNFINYAHVRKFKNKEEIITRYGKLIKINNIEIYEFSGKSKIFVIQGIKL